MNSKIALITGGNKGLGFEICRQLAHQNIKIILTARDCNRGQQAVEKLGREGLDVEFHQLDVSDVKSIRALYNWIEERFGRLDILINNAGIALDPPGNPTFTLIEMQERFLKTFNTNLIGAYLLCDLVFPLMEKNGYGRIVNVSSSAGQLSQMGDNYPAYRISKTALNGVTRLFASKCQERDILVNSVCPGWVKTDMGGEKAHLEPHEGVLSIVWAATLSKDGPNGDFIREKKSIPW